MRRRLILGVVLAAASALAVMLGWRAFSPASRNPRLRALIAAAADLEERPFAVRLSGGFPYRPLAPALRGSNPDDPKPSRWKGFAAAAELQETALKDPSPESLHAFGLSQLFLRHPSSALETLEAALFRETRQNDVTAAIAKSADSVLLSDLAAAYFLRSQTAHHARDLMAAAECAARARRLDAQSSEAAWNRAVIFESIGVTDVARSAWSDFLAIDSVSEWAVEAREHLRTLAAPPLAQRWETERQQLLDAAGAGRIEMVNVLVQRYPEQARTLVEEDLLGEWAEACDAHDDRGAADTLARARVIADAVGTISHDFLARDATAVVARNAPDAVPFLIRGHRSYLAARKLYKSGQHPQAEPMLAAAAADLERVGSPLSFRAGAYDITSKDYLGRPAEAIAQGQVLLKRLGPAAVSYPTVTGMLYWTCGLASRELGSIDEALENDRKALAAFQHTEETSNLAGLVQVISSDYRAVGDLNNAWLYQLQSFQLASRYASFERAQVVVGTGAVAALRNGYPTVADELQGGVLDRARTAGQPIFICAALIRRSETLAALGALREARAAVAEALKEWGSVAETAMKSRLRADLEMAHSALSSDLAPRERITQLNTAMEYVSKSNSRSRVAKVLLLRARAHRDAGDETSAEHDLASGIGEVERQREKTTSDESRLTFLDTAVDLYDEAMRIHLRRSEDVAAFDVLERRRARWLLDRFQGDGILDNETIEPWSALRAEIPQGVAIVSFAVSNEINACVATRSSLKCFSFRRTRGEIEGYVTALRDAIARGDIADTLRSSNSVDETLMEPLRSELNGSRAIVFLPDRFLNALPFSALHDKRTGRYLVEDFAITVAPSANLYIRSLRRARTISVEGTALIIANPALPDDESLQPLPGADAEASEIAAVLPLRSVLRGTDATAERFLKAAPEASLIHFAGHAVINPQRPDLSSLLFAPNRAGEGTRLYARDIYRMRLPRTRLVVLAACDSAIGKTLGDSSLSLATSFIAAGVPTAIASLWAVDDATSAVFFADVYRRLRDGMPPAEALRQAQVLSLRSRNISPATWAAYEVIGGS